MNRWWFELWVNGHSRSNAVAAAMSVYWWTVVQYNLGLSKIIFAKKTGFRSSIFVNPFCQLD